MEFGRRLSGNARKNHPQVWRMHNIGNSWKVIMIFTAKKSRWIRTKTEFCWLPAREKEPILQCPLGLLIVCQNAEAV
jgi:hypothetical protein